MKWWIDPFIISTADEIICKFNLHVNVNYISLTPVPDIISSKPLQMKRKCNNQQSFSKSSFSTPSRMNVPARLPQINTNYCSTAKMQDDEETSSFNVLSPKLTLRDNVRCSVRELREFVEYAEQMEGAVETILSNICKLGKNLKRLQMKMAKKWI